jgi:hypothetical protein
MAILGLVSWIVIGVVSLRWIEARRRSEPQTSK